MVKRIPINKCCLYALIMSAMTGVAYGEYDQEWQSEFVVRPISADACDERRLDDDTQTAENRAVDKASLSAVKLSGIIQEKHPNLSANAIDIISYRIIDEYMVNVAHAIKFSDDNRVCVKLMAEVEISATDLQKLVDEYEDSDAPAQQIAEVAEQVKNDISFKPENLGEKKLVYIKKMIFWNGAETDHYSELLTSLFSNSEYFYVTKDENIADFVITPRLQRSEVDEIDSNNHKMQMAIELETTSLSDKSFTAMIEQQEHSILFASEKDEQKIADDLLQKLLTKAAREVGRKIDKYEAIHLETAKVYGK